MFAAQGGNALARGDMPRPDAHLTHVSEKLRHAQTTPSDATHANEDAGFKRDNSTADRFSVSAVPMNSAGAGFESPGPQAPPSSAGGGDQHGGRRRNPGETAAGSTPIPNRIQRKTQQQGSVYSGPVAPAPMVTPPSKITRKGSRMTSAPASSSSSPSARELVLGGTDITEHIVTFLAPWEILDSVCVCRGWSRRLHASTGLLDVTRRIVDDDIENLWLLTSREIKYELSDYMPLQPQFTRAMRSTLFDWILKLNRQFKHRRKTGFLAIRLVDRVLNGLPVHRSEMQLLGAVALFIAAKMEQEVPPHLNDLEYLCARQYAKHQFMVMELVVLKQLQFRVHCPVLPDVIEYLCFSVGASDEMLVMCNYVSDMAALDYSLVHIRPSVLGAAIVVCVLYNYGVSFSVFQPICTHLDALLTCQLPLSPEQERVRGSYAESRRFCVSHRLWRVGALGVYLDDCEETTDASSSGNELEAGGTGQAEAVV